jgi:hypothetical protein
MLNSETRPLLPAGFEALGEREALVTLHEGRYHQVRRMFAAAGKPRRLPEDLKRGGTRRGLLHRRPFRLRHGRSGPILSPLMTKDATEIEVEVVEIDGITGRSRSTRRGNAAGRLAGLAPVAGPRPPTRQPLVAAVGVSRDHRPRAHSHRRRRDRRVVFSPPAHGGGQKNLARSERFSHTAMAYAVIKTGGKQYRVQEGTKFDVEKLDAEVDSKSSSTPCSLAKAIP